LTAFTYSGSACTTITYTLSNSAGSIDSIFTFNAATPSISVSTIDTTKIGTYTFTLTGTLDSATSTTSTITVNVVSHCYGQTVSASTIAGQSYNVGGTSITLPITGFTPSSGGTCSAITYSLTNSDASSYDSTVFTFTSSPL
jgi:hypothetical protein